MKRLSSAFFLIALISFPLSGRYHCMRGKKKFERLMYLIDESKSPREVKKILTRSSFSKKELAAATKQARNVLAMRKKHLQTKSHVPDTTPRSTRKSLVPTGISFASILALVTLPAYLLLRGCTYLYKLLLLPLVGMIPFGAHMMRSKSTHSRTTDKKIAVSRTNKQLENAQKITELLIQR